MSENEEFPCTRCGECCRNLWMFGKAYEWLLASDGCMCRYFNPQSNLCAIYPIRPIICNVKLGHAVFFKEMPYDLFIKKNLEGCAILQDLKRGQS